MTTRKTNDKKEKVELKSTAEQDIGRVSEIKTKFRGDVKKEIKTTDSQTAALMTKDEKSKTLKELKNEQAVKPFDISKTGNWPEGADFDEFTKAINSGRKNPREW
jgi:hypothetical protein